MNNYELITIIGPTASGKTAFAAALAARLDTEIISGDSRQVYRSMDIGTGKDLADYVVDGKQIPYHLIDICNPGDKYNVFEYQHDFHKAFEEIRKKGKLPILCGGTGMYIESVLRGFKLLDVPQNPALRESLKGKSLAELEQILIIGVDIDRELRREKISRRLRARLDEGMVDEVRAILATGVKPEDLIYYGLEYKFLTLYIIGQLTYDEMISQLEIAIHQFAKRQMTWFRGMERRGLHIHWLDATLPTDEKINNVLALIQ